MVTTVSDSQVVGETEAQLFQLLQSGPTDTQIIIKNTGENTMNYRFQEYNGTAWVDLGASGSVFYTTLTVDQVRLVTVDSDYPQVRLLGNASGGAFLEFNVTRYFNRASGGSLPLLNV